MTNAYREENALLREALNLAVLKLSALGEDHTVHRVRELISGIPKEPYPPPVIMIREFRKLITEDEIAEAKSRCDRCGLIRLPFDVWIGGAGRLLCGTCGQAEGAKRMKQRTTSAKGNK